MWEKKKHALREVDMFVFDDNSLCESTVGPPCRHATRQVEHSQGVGSPTDTEFPFLLQWVHGSLLWLLRV